MWIGLFRGAAFLAASGAFWLLPMRDAEVVASGALLAFVGAVARGMFSVRSSILERTHWRSDDAGEKRVGLSFDDGPHPQWTPAVLDTLKARGIHATFFVIGENARRHPELVRRIHEEGHEIGCHGDSHAWTTPFFPPRRLDGEIERCRDAIRAAAGVTPRLYRPPIGFRSRAHIGISKRRDLLVVGMARRGLDTKPGLDPASFARRFVAASAGGEVLALHDGEAPLHPAPREATVAALPLVLDGLAAKGLLPVPVSALLAERPYRESRTLGWTGRSPCGRLGMAIFARTARAFGHRGCLVVAPLVASWYVAVHPSARRASIAFRRRLHGPAGLLREIWWSYRHFHAFGRTMIDRMAFVHGGAPPPATEVAGFDDVRGVIEEKGGVLLVSGHVGDGIAASRLTKFRSRLIWVVASQGMGAGGPHQVHRDGGAHLYRIINADAHSVAVGAQIAAALRSGGLVALFGDRRVSADVVRLPFLGGEADFPTGPWAVALVTGAPVVVSFMLRMPDGSNRMQFYGPIRVASTSREGRATAIGSGAAQFARYLEDAVRQSPFQWANFFDFWDVG